MRMHDDPDPALGAGQLKPQLPVTQGHLVVETGQKLVGHVISCLGTLGLKGSFCFFFHWFFSFLLHQVIFVLGKSYTASLSSWKNSAVLA